MTKSPKPPAAFNARHSLESFDPRYRDMLRAALSSEIRIPCSSISEARHLQTRIQMYRKRLLEVNDPEARTFYKLKTSRTDNVLTIRNADAVFDGLLAQFTSSEPTAIFESEVPIDESEVPNSTPIPKPESSSTITLDELFAGMNITETTEDKANDI